MLYTIIFRDSRGNVHGLEHEHVDPRGFPFSYHMLADIKDPSVSGNPSLSEQLDKLHRYTNKRYAAAILAGKQPNPHLCEMYAQTDYGQPWQKVDLTGYLRGCWISCTFTGGRGDWTATKRLRKHGTVVAHADTKQKALDLLSAKLDQVWLNA